jgi:hypothetical protein
VVPCVQRLEPPFVRYLCPLHARGLHRPRRAGGRAGARTAAASNSALVRSSASISPTIRPSRSLHLMQSPAVTTEKARPCPIRYSQRAACQIL